MRCIGGAAPAAHGWRQSRATWLALSAAAALGGCIVGDDKCGANQELTDGRICVCAEGSVPDPRGYGCRKCGEHEEAVSGQCRCAPGYAAPSEGMPCEEVTGGVAGAPCSADMPCAEPYPYCATVDGESFCTSQGCAVNSDCPPAWMCDTPGPDGFCRVPRGLGQPCASPADCADGDATFCETFVTQTCIVQNCLRDPGVCPSGNVCCDLSTLTGASLCTPTGVLMGGLCPDGKAPVSP